MVKRRKTRTHLKGANAREVHLDGIPKSFIIKHGQVGSSLTQLVRDMRKVMEPNTASRLKERLRNKLKDYITMAPALQVTHLLAFTLTPLNPSLRIIRLSSGPTLSFRLERYSLMKDVLNSTKRARSTGIEYLAPPLLVLASFPPPSPSTPAHLSLLMKTFQSLFPPLSPQTLSLSQARRVVLVSYDRERDTVDIRHYTITVKPYGVSKRLRKILEGGTSARSSFGFLDLGTEKDVADFVLRRRGEAGPDGYESASSAESAAGDEHATVDLAEDYVGRNNKKGQRRAVRLDEVGPRLELRLVKITEGIPGKEGAVIYHGLVKKSKKEATELAMTHAAKERLRKERREEQERNVQRKKALNVKEEDEGTDGSENEDQDPGQDDEDEGAWNEDEEISEGEASEEDGSDVESSEEEGKPPAKRPRVKGKR